MNPMDVSAESAIFAVDDDRDDIDLLRLLLRKTGLPNPVQVYRTGGQLVNALTKMVDKSVKAVRPLLCFLDVKMSAMNGHEVLRWIRAQRPLDCLPVVMLSTSEHPRDVQQAAQHGAQCYLVKYPQPKILLEVVQDAHRFAAGTPAEECFCLPSNQLLVRCRRLTPPRAVDAVTRPLGANVIFRSSPPRHDDRR